MAVLERLVVELATDASKYKQGLSDASGATSSWGGKLAGLAGKAALGAMAAAGVAIAGIGVAGVKEFIGFQTSMNEVFTLLPGMSADAMGQMQEDVKGFAKEFGVLPKETIPALYQAISSGVPKDNVFDFLEVAQKAARAGVTDLTTTVDGLSTVVNAYGKEIISAEKASDLIFTAVKMGKTTFDEMSASIFQVVPTAASLGVGFDQVAAAMAAITLQGVPTSVASTQLRQLLVELSKAGSEASDAFKQLAGKDFQSFIAEGKTLQDGLNLMAGGLTTTSSNAGKAAEKTDSLRRSIDRLQDRLAVARQRQSEFNDKTKESLRLGNQQTIDQLTADLAALDGELAGVTVTSSTTTTKMTDLFGSVEAGNAALMLTGTGSETFTNILGEMGKSAGATDAAFATMSGGISASLDRLKASWSVMLLDVGERAAPAFAGLAEMANKALPYVGEAAVGLMTIVGEGVQSAVALAGTVKKAWDEDYGGIRTTAEEVGAALRIEWLKTRLEAALLVQEIEKTFAEADITLDWSGIKIPIDDKTNFVLEWADAWEEIKGVTSRGLINIPAQIGQGFVYVRGAWKYVTSLLTGDWQGAWDGWILAAGAGLDSILGLVDVWSPDLARHMSDAVKALSLIMQVEWAVLSGLFTEYVVKPVQDFLAWLRKYNDTLRPGTRFEYPTDPTGVPGYATGTNFAPGGMALVGEEGPELVDLPRGSRVSPAGKTREMLKGLNIPVDFAVAGLELPTLAGLSVPVDFAVSGLELPTLPPMTQEVALEFAAGRMGKFEAMGKDAFNSRDMIALLKQAGERTARLAETGQAQLATLRQGIGQQIGAAGNLLSGLRSQEPDQRENSTRQLEWLLGQLQASVDFSFAPGATIPDGLRDWNGDSGGGNERATNQTNHFVFNITAKSEAEARSGVLSALRQSGVAFA